MPLLTDGFEWWAKAAPDKVALTFDGDELTYAALDSWAGATAAQLRERGVQVGDRVGMIADNRIEYCVAAVAVLKAGGIVVPMSTRLTPGEIDVLSASSKPRLILVDDATEGLIDRTEAAGAACDVDFVTGLRAASGSPERPDVDPASPAALIYTSGTTGTPKGVIFSHRSVLGFIHEWGLIEAGFNRDMRHLWMLPLGGAPGMVWGIFHVFHRGGTLVLHRSLDPGAAIRSLQEDRITSAIGVPIIFETIAQHPGFAEAEFPAWDVAHVGGAPVSDRLLRIYADKGVLLRQIYGMTEAGGSATVNPRERALERPELCGGGGPYTRVRTMRQDGTFCDPGEEGEIVIKGPAVTPGYWGNEEATRQTIRDGWLHSGDLGVLDEDGHLRFVDRLKDLIISGGLNIAPVEIENVVARLPQVAEVAVIAASDARFGETPAAIVRLEGELGPEEIVAHCNEHLADYKVPRYVVFTDEPLPRMASGKVAKRELRKTYADLSERYEKVR